MIPTIKILEKQEIHNQRYHLNQYIFHFTKGDLRTETHSRIVFHRGNGSNILLFNPESKNIILTRQFRLPTYLNGNPDGMLLEVCAGTLEHENPEECIIRETEEETGFRIQKVSKVFEAYMSPGSVTEMLHFFIGEYNHDMKVSSGGGLVEEQEDIEVVEMPFQEAIRMLEMGEIKDAKTIILLQYAQIHNLLKI